MTCIICQKEIARAEDIEPLSSDNYPICVKCVDAQVDANAERKAKEAAVPEMIRSRPNCFTGFEVEDTSPEQMSPDNRCEYCVSGKWHSQQAHEDSVNCYVEEAEIAELRASHYDEQSDISAWLAMNVGA